MNLKKLFGRLLNQPLFFIRMIATISFAINLFFIQSLRGQENKQTEGTRKEIQLTPERLKSFEGVFQNSGNDELNVQFTSKGNTLLAKLLWNGREITLFPESALDFFSKEEGEGLSIRFLAGPDGTPIQVKVGNQNDLWNRIKNYRPLIRKEISHTPEQLKVFEGIYQLQRDKDLYIQFTEKRNNLVLKQHWDGEEIRFVPDSALHFFNQDQILFTLRFTKDQEGKVTQMLAFNRDLWDKLKMVHPTQDQLKTFEGIYQFKDDKDDLIRITAKEGNLVIKQIWDGKEIIASPQVQDYFYSNDQSFPVKFIRNNDGVIVQALLLNQDLFEKIKE